MMEQIVKLNYDEYQELCRMLLSSDKSNETVALEVIHNLDVEHNLVYLMFLHHFHGNTLIGTWQNLKNRIDKKLLEIDDNILFTYVCDGIICIDTIYYVSKTFYPETLDSVEKIISKWLLSNLVSMGWEIADRLEIK